MDKSSSVPIINLSPQENKNKNEKKDSNTKKKVSIPMIPVIPRKNQNLNQQPNLPLSNVNNEIPSIPTIQPPVLPKSEGGFPLLNLSFASVPELKLNLSEMTLQDGKKKMHDKKQVVICVPFMNDNVDIVQSNKNNAKDRPINKKIINFFGGTAEFTDIYLNSITEPPVTIVEYNDSTPSLIPSFQAIDSAYQEMKHLPQMIDRVTNESSEIFAMIEEMMNEIEHLKNQKEEMTVKNAVMKEKIRSSKEEAQRFNESAVKMKNSFDEFLKKLPKT